MGAEVTPEFRLLLIPCEGEPHFVRAEGTTRSAAVKHGCLLINHGDIKAVVVYRRKQPTQLLVHRPQTYVHIERI